MLGISAVEELNVPRVIHSSYEVPKFNQFDDDTDILVLNFESADVNTGNITHHLLAIP